MPGGLIQIATHGSQDIYLTGNPEITFFKSVYKRHTNFSIESKVLEFDSGINFGELGSVTIPKNADLVHKVYLELKLPEINIKRINTSTGNNDVLLESMKLYKVIKNFMKLNLSSYRLSLSEYTPENVFDSGAIIESIKQAFNSELNKPIIDQTDLTAEDELNKYLLRYYNNDERLRDNQIKKISLKSLLDNYNDNDPKDTIMNAIESNITNSIELNKEIYNNYLRIKEEHDIESNDNTKFAWVKNIGTSIIEYIEIDIGGRTIDKHYGEWMFIWSELTESNFKKENYNKMIGNVDILTNYDNNIKPEYNLIIPLYFWFNRHNGLSLPLIAIEYQDVKINVKIRDFNECCYIEDNVLVKINDNVTDYKLNDLVNEDIIKLNGTISIDYIYLGNNERQLFSQSKHEYLIEQTQYQEFPNINNVNELFKFNFLYPCKEIIWVLQKDKYITKTRDSDKLQWDNYSLSDNYKGYPILKSLIYLGTYERTLREGPFYYNYLLPLKYHSKTPSDGINVYSFSLKPEEYQPSGSCNMSEITELSMEFQFDKSLFYNSDTCTLKVFVTNYNVLAISGGMCEVTFV